MASTVDQKLLKSTKFPPEFNEKVDMKKVNVEVMKTWIAGKLAELLGIEDDVVIELCFNLLEGSRFPNIKNLQIQLTGFLDKSTAPFCKELWSLCLSAQANPQGVPKELLEAKKLELIQEKINADKAADAARRKREEEREKERSVDQIRQRERGEQGRGGRGRGGWGGRNQDRNAPRESRSPPPRRARDQYSGPSRRQETDTYVPKNERRNPAGRERGQQLHSRSPTRRRKPRSRSRSSTPVIRNHHSSRARSPSATTTRPQHKSSSELVSRDVDQSNGGRHSDMHDKDSKRTEARSGYGNRHQSRSRSPKRRHHHQRAASPLRSKSHSRSRSRSRSSCSRSRSPSGRNRRRHKRSDRRAHSKSRSKHLPSRSPSLDRHGRLNSSHKHRRSPSSDAVNSARARADIGEKQDRSRRHRHASSSSRSRSPRPRHERRRRSLERYEPAAKRRKNTSSPEPDTASDGAGEAKTQESSKEHISSRSRHERSANSNADMSIATHSLTANEERAKSLRERIIATRKARTHE